MHSFYLFKLSLKVQEIMQIILNSLGEMRLNLIVFESRISVGIYFAPALLWFSKFCLGCFLSKWLWINSMNVSLGMIVVLVTFTLLGQNTWHPLTNWRRKGLGKLGLGVALRRNMAGRKQQAFSLPFYSIQSFPLSSKSLIYT